MPDKFTSAIVAKFVVEKIINYVTVYKTIKQKRNVIFLESKVKEAELIYKNAQNKQADYKDNSLGVILIKAQTNEQILNNQMTIAFNIYSQLFMQLEQAKVDLNQETPIFSSIEAIGIPSIKSDPAFLKIFLKNIFLMIIISFFVLFINLFRK
jgi:diacylglycerol kinase family enzyme